MLHHSGTWYLYALARVTERPTEPPETPNTKRPMVFPLNPAYSGLLEEREWRTQRTTRVQFAVPLDDRAYGYHEFCETALKLCVEVEVHEAREWFFANGDRVFDPHDPYRKPPVLDGLRVA